MDSSESELEKLKTRPAPVKALEALSKARQARYEKRKAEIEAKHAEKEKKAEAVAAFSPKPPAPEPAPQPQPPVGLDLTSITQRLDDLSAKRNPSPSARSSSRKAAQRRRLWCVGDLRQSQLYR
jgi:hypothetical protein